jgi:hypothetical protein
LIRPAGQPQSLPPTPGQFAKSVLDPLAAEACAPSWLNTAAAMIGISSGIGTPRLPSKSTAKTPTYVKLLTNSWSASAASPRDEMLVVQAHRAV